MLTVINTEIIFIFVNTDHDHPAIATCPDPARIATT
jgi:hypothetical protein